MTLATRDVFISLPEDLGACGQNRQAKILFLYVGVVMAAGDLDYYTARLCGNKEWKLPKQVLLRT